MRVLGQEEVDLVGVDLPLHAERERYREVIDRIKSDDHEIGGLVTTHKVHVFEACRDQFDAIAESAELCGETSCLAKQTGRLIAYATDPVSSGRALAEFYRSAGEVLCIGGGGSAAAITVHLLQSGQANRITVVNRSPGRLEALRTIHSKLRPGIEIEYIENSDPRVNDELMAALPAGSLVINATGMGKDTPGSPITDAAVFPEGGYAWELNYRGELAFLHQARRQAASRAMHVEDGWRYFIHGWAAVMEQVFQIEIGREQIERLSAVSEPERPTLL